MCSLSAYLKFALFLTKIVLLQKNKMNKETKEIDVVSRSSLSSRKCTVIFPFSRARVRLVSITIVRFMFNFVALRFNSHAVCFCDSSILSLSLGSFCVFEKLSGSLRVYSQNCTCKRINKSSCVRTRSGVELYDEVRL